MEEQIPEKRSDDQQAKKQNKGSLRMLKYNRWIVKNIPFYFFLSAIAIVYIANGHYADKTMRKINSTSSHLKEMEYEFKTIKQDVIFRSKESELVRVVEPLGLKPLMAPPVRIIDTLEIGN
jgi:hypothetical protein